MAAHNTEFPTFHLDAVGIKATARLEGEHFVVLKGSQARATVVDSYEKHVIASYRHLRSNLIDQGKLQLTNGVYLFTEDVPFDTPTPAAIVVLGRNDGGPKIWKRSLPDGQLQTYGAWVEQHRTQLPVSVASQILEPTPATWRPFFRELAVRLLEFQARQPELVDILRVAGISIVHDEGEPLVVMDPFTVFALINKHSKLETVQGILRHLKAALQLEADVPADLLGVPTITPFGAWFFPYRSQRQPSDLPTLWELARQAVTGALEPETFAAGLRIRHVKLAKLTQGLFWLNPDAFLALNSVNIPYLEARGLRGAGNVQTLDTFKAVLEQARVLAPDFVTLSHTAWQEAQQRKEVATLEDGHFPFAAFREDASRYREDTVKGNIQLDRKYAPLLLALMQNIGLNALTPNRSPHKGRDKLAARIALSEGRSDEGAFSFALLLPDQGSEGVPLAAGLTLALGVADARCDALRDALRHLDGRARLLEVLRQSEHEWGAIPQLFIGTQPPVQLNSEREVELEAHLEAFTNASDAQKLFQVTVTLTPSELQSETFTNLLERATAYLDELKPLLDELSQVLPSTAPSIPAIHATGMIQDPEPAGFTPPPGIPLNQILYGPPGTGKTHRVVDEALRILDPAFAAQHPGSANRRARKARYDELLEAGHVTFVTFHQSFGYEDFIEGIKPVMKDGQLHYELEDGLFLQAIRAAGGMFDGEASSSIPPRSFPDVHPDAHVWRIYIDGTLAGSEIRRRSLERGEIRIGSWLDDPSAESDRAPSGRTVPVDLGTIPEGGWHAQQRMFIEEVRVGDVVLLATGIDRIGAVGVVTGEYRFDVSEAIFSENFAHARAMRWLARDLDWKASTFTGKQFSRTTLQRLDGVVPQKFLAKLESGHAINPTVSSLRPHVLIVDEINRGNVAKIFGELITLLEPSKRSGAAESLTVRLPLSKRRLRVPQSLYVIGTMNTADRSLTLLDAALRRRFVFHPVWPDPAVLPVVTLEGGIALDLAAFLEAINRRLERLLSREQVIGHAYLLDIPESLEGVAQALQQRILPLLEEYFFEDWDRIRRVLGDDQKPEAMQFVREMHDGDSKRYERNPQAFASVEAFVRVYSGVQDIPSSS
jgi:5-methylcytosine-specific restriction endonuclease McrBC GTP-binding regulatory subunit McrB